MGRDKGVSRWRVHCGKSGYCRSKGFKFNYMFLTLKDVNQKGQNSAEKTCPQAELCIQHVRIGPHVVDQCLY